MIKKHLAFFEDYHKGAANILLHFLGFSLWGIGVGGKNWVLIIISPLIFESGHLVNYFISKRTKFDKVMIPIQLLTWITFIYIGFLLTNIF